MATLLLSLFALTIFAGCASKTLYWGPALSTCSGPDSAANFAKGACRSGAEYDIARKKTKGSLSNDVLGYNEDLGGRFSQIERNPECSSAPLTNCCKRSDA